jgi:hypothetical protein
VAQPIVPAATPTQVASQRLFNPKHFGGRCGEYRSLCRHRCYRNIADCDHRRDPRCDRKTEDADGFANPGVTFKYDTGVTAEQAREIEDAVVLSKKYLGEVYNVQVYAFSDLTCVPQEPDSPDITCPSVRGYLGIATGNLIELNLATPSWQKSTPAGRKQVVVHEYAHIVQNYSASKQSASPLSSGLGPLWLIEGGADYLSAWVVSSERLYDYSTVRDSTMTRAKRINAPLQSIESYSGARAAGPGSEYTLGFFGAEFLARNYGGEQNVLKFFRSTATSRTWHDAFKETFGISIAEFYDKFEEYRRTNLRSNP